MTLIAHQTNGCSALTIKTRPCSRVLVRRTDKFASLKHRFQFRGRPIILSKEKHFKVSSFKGNDHGDASDDMERDSKCSKQVQLPLAPQEREEVETASADSSSSSIPCASVSGENNVAGSRTIERLFKSLLGMLRTCADEIEENQEKMLETKADNMAKAALLWFMGLDLTLKIPLLIFIPWYFITRVAYGIEVTKELTPLWTIGPLITALYIRTIQGICSLYVFCFKKAIELLGNLPSYYALICSYLVEGKLRELLYAKLCKPVADVKNTDYEALARLRTKQLREWAVEKYVDYVESIWPLYCRTIRFLKKANLL
ncbi:unnamed protein product [Spirodela intermedia]|uniref:Uncharacterized protein n=1 Tax=Spirodela intermedia TaxID=51605 RepID=A0A7I8J699_SPIIN|nr:unnamed protein product [Spirodela intermedia]CAA6665520.1 unnamed protein product [Spirodela intermedia]